MLYLENSGAAFWSWSKHAGAVARPVALSVAASCYVVDRLGAQNPSEFSAPKSIHLSVGQCWCLRGPDISILIFNTEAWALAMNPIHGLTLTCARTRVWQTQEADGCTEFYLVGCPFALLPCSESLRNRARHYFIFFHNT